MLARLGATEQDIVNAAHMISGKSRQLEEKGFSEAIEKASDETSEHFHAWCVQHGLDPEKLDEAALDQLLEQAIHQVRKK